MVLSRAARSDGSIDGAGPPLETSGVIERAIAQRAPTGGGYNAAMIVLLLALLAARPAMPVPALRARAIASVPAALEELLARRPRVVAFGEIHQTTASLRVPSSLKHFTDELLAVVAPRASDLVVETWMTEGKCGKTEAAVIKHVQKATERPAQTEDEVVTLLQRSKAAGVKAHILSVSCREYEAIYQGQGGGRVDYDALLRMTSDKLEAGIREVLGKPGGRDEQRAIVVYGGALHNDLTPPAGLSAYAFGESVSKTVGGKYLEVDLYVPEYAEKQKNLRAEAWYAAYRRAARPGKAVLIERSLASYVIVFPHAAKRSPARPPRR
jgi:hypothetical protein